MISRTECGYTVLVLIHRKPSAMTSDLLFAILEEKICAERPSIFPISNHSKKYADE